MEYKYFEPEVSGGFGKNTKLDNSIHPPLIKELHYEFDGWLGNDIIESFPCFIVTKKLKNSIENHDLTGLSFADVTVTTSITFKEIYPSKVLPKFYWIKVNGIAGSNDFGVANDHRLVISSKAYSVLNEFNISEADIEDFY